MTPEVGQVNQDIAVNSWSAAPAAVAIGIDVSFVPPQVHNWVALREVFNGGTPAGATVTRKPGQITAVFANGERFVFHING